MSRASDGVLKFGKWLPDLPTLDNPGLVEAFNVLPVDGTYKPFRYLATQLGALATRPYGAVSVLDSSGNAFLYAGTATDLFQRSVATWVDRSTAVAYTLSSIDYWRFAQFDEFVIGTSYSDLPQKLVIGAAADFEDLADTGTAPRARAIGVIGRFVVLGNTNEAVNGVQPTRLQWCAIDDCTDWPIPNTADALTKQAGEQFQRASCGPVMAIEGEQQFGIIFQRTGIARATYIGGDRVFQFDYIDQSRGLYGPNAVATVGMRRYFVSTEGFYVTDGVNVEPIGNNQVDRFFLDDFDATYPERIYAAADKERKLIYFAYPGAGNTGGQPNHFLMYNYIEQRWTRADEDVVLIIDGLSIATSIDDFDDLFDSIDDISPPLDSSFWSGGAPTILGFSDAAGDTSLLGTFSADPGATDFARIETAEVELNPGLYTYISGVKPLVTGTDEDSIISVRLKVRNLMTEAQAEAPGSFQSATPTATTGYCDFDSESIYNSVVVQIVGLFDRAIGIHYQQQASGT